MKELYYYLRDEHKHPRVTVCLLIGEKGAVGRGVSLCSMKDNPIKKRGRSIAKNRAQIALVRQESSKKMSRYEAFHIVDQVGTLAERVELFNKRGSWWCKSAFISNSDQLTEIEKKLLQATTKKEIDNEHGV